MNFDTQPYFDGQWRPGRSGRAPVLNPASEEMIGSVALVLFVALCLASAARQARGAQMLAR
jgi:hypothetical protein